MTVESFSPADVDLLGLPLQIDGKRALQQWSSGLPGFVKVYLALDGEIPTTVTVSTRAGEIRLAIPETDIE